MKARIEEKASELMVRMYEISRRIRSRELDFAKGVDTDLNHHEIGILFRVGMGGECTMSQLAKEIGLSMSSATTIADRLVQKGIVSREHSIDDRRVVMIRLTAEGKQTYKVIYDNFQRMGQTMLESLSEQEQDMLLTLYGKIASKLS